MFFITEDITDAPVLGKNLRIPSKDCPLPADAVLPEIRALMPYQFRLRDNEGELYYEGYYNGLHQGSIPALYEPLRWAMKYTACSQMEFFNKFNHWQRLP